jgi:hypothetical protein
VLNVLTPRDLVRTDRREYLLAAWRSSGPAACSLQRQLRAERLLTATPEPPAGIARQRLRAVTQFEAR